MTADVEVQPRRVRAMGTALPAFTPLEDSLFLTPCARALDNRSPHLVLADATADEIVHALEYDYEQFHISTNLMINVAFRAKKPRRGGVEVHRAPSQRGRP